MNENELLIEIIKNLINKIDTLINILIEINDNDQAENEDAEPRYLDGRPIINKTGE